MNIVIENITPAKAQAWLNSNKSNRKLRPGIVEKYAQDMRDGNWTSYPTPISFYDDGEVADGQHRLWGIVESNVTVKFPVARGLTRADGMNIDVNLPRNLVDAGRISGIDTNLSNTLIATARAVATGQPPQRAFSFAEKLNHVNEHREAVKFAMGSGVVGKGIRVTATMAAIARAWYIETDHDKIRRFAWVLNSGHGDGEYESAAIAMRNYLLSKGPQASSSALWRDTFMKAQNALYYFMHGKRLMTIRGTETETYPLKATKAKRR